MSSSSASCKRIMIVEDEPDIREALEAFLEMDGFETVLASDGLDGFKKLENGARPDLILLDLTMPQMNGWEFLEKKRTSEYRAIPVIVLTAGGEGASLEGAIATLRKPFRMQALRAIIDKLPGPPSSTLAEAKS